MAPTRSISNFLSLVKFSHTIFALPFAIIGFLLAIFFTDAVFSIQIFILVILCMVFARSAAMAFNRYADRDIDKNNPRTEVREIPAGIIKAKSALIFVVFNMLLFVITTYFINPICFYLSPIALLVILGYSYAKRITFLSHLILGLGLSLAPIGAYLAVTGEFDWMPLFFSFAVLFWVSGFDIIYALQDIDFDKSQNLKSFPVKFGKVGALRLSSLFHVFTAAFILGAGYYGGMGTWYWVGSAFFILLLFYQHMLVKPDDLSKINLAFFTTNGIASVVFAIFVTLDLLLQ
ncbi:MAG: 4-hydroxybenzoate octaprenyltransferase [Bacteroidetes bacterium]|nr:MAG: 4-hydroxybenzoate octaprenyltransferase [Bacteroidota bacterium]